jgi:hypothetical protein
MGHCDDGADARWRRLVYEGRNIAVVRIERHRLGKHDSVAGTYDELGTVPSRLRRATEEAERRG